MQNPMCRREFLAKVAASAPILIAGGAYCERTTATEEPTRRSLSPVDRFNYIVGTQTFDPAYRFTNKERLLESAEAIRDMGSSVIKFNISWDKFRGSRPSHLTTLTDLASRDGVIRQILEMPFADYLLWTYPLRKAPTGARDEELYELGCHLLERYNGTGKRFYLGHWEGDWEIRGRAGSKEDPTPAAIANKIRWLTARQRAVDDAKAATTHKDVALYCYAEANLVADAMSGRPAMANSVIPEANVDYVSYSSYDVTNRNVAGLPAALDFIQAKLPRKPNLSGKRVWIGEYGFPAENHSPAEQAGKTRQVMRAAIEWGCPFVLYWQMYNNEVTTEGRQRGFWLIDDKGAKQPVYTLHEQFSSWGRKFVDEAIRRSGQPPSDSEYRKAALQHLDSVDIR